MAIAVSLTLVLAVVLSIVVLYRKNLIIEIFAWLLGAGWLILFIFLKNQEFFLTVELLDLYIYPILLTFYLLLLYRSRLAQGNKLKLLYIVKASIVLIAVSTIFPLLMRNVLLAEVTSGGYTSENVNSTLSLLSNISSVIFWAVMLILCVDYLYKINQSIAAVKDIFINAAMFTLLSYIIMFIANISLTHLKQLSGNQLITIEYSKDYWLKNVFFTIVSTGISSLIAAYIYRWKIKNAALKTN